jgi:hypothetical protein
MDSKKGVKPLQVRLPADVYEALQYEASAKGGTMNSVVVECLRTNLPDTYWTDFALVRDRGVFSDDPEVHRKNAQDALGNYQAKVLNEIWLLNTLIQMRSSQLGSVVNINKSMREGWEVSPPQEIARSEAGALDVGQVLTTKDTNNLAKNEEKTREVLKALARARAEAQIEQRLFYTHLERWNGSRKSTSPGVPASDSN